MARVLLQFAYVLALCSLVASQRGKTCSTGVEEAAGGEVSDISWHNQLLLCMQQLFGHSRFVCCLKAIDGAHSARLGFSMMKEAVKDPSVMMDAMKDLQDPENQAEVQRMMQDPSFRKCN